MKNIENKRIKIDGNRIFLRILRQSDATKEYCGWLNDSRVNLYLATKRATIAGLKKYIREKNKSSNALLFGIFFRENQKHIGNIKLEPIDFKESKTTVGIMIGDKNYWGKGLATEAIKLLTDFAFRKLKLGEVNLGVISEHKSAIKAYKKAGLKIDKVEKKSVRYGNKVYDKLTMSIKNVNTRKHERKI